MDIALRDGTPANRLATDLKQYLKYPDKLFRRVWDEHGQLQLSKRAKEFHPGAGVYRSSYKNAHRLAVTETNMADNERWRQLDFVLGYEVQVSGTNPNVCPLCVELAGKYPKEFEFVGWHPHCRCHAVPIMEDIDSFQARQEALLRGERIPATGQVTEPPKNFTDHLKDNRDRIQRASKAGTLPYFVRDNYITDKDGSLFPLFGYETNTLKLKAFKAKAIELHHGKTFRDGITISNKAIKEWFNQPHVARDSKDKALFNIGKVLDTSTYIGQGIDKHDPNIKMHIYQTKVGLTDSCIVVREFPWGKQLHSISDNRSILQIVKHPKK